MQTLDVISVNIWQILASLLNLVLLFLIVKYFLYKPVKNVLASRRASIDKEYSDAEEAKNKALSDKAEYIEAETSCAPCIYLCAKDKENTLESLVESGRSLYTGNPDAYHNAEIDPFKMSLLVFTSGTTGKGKGVMLCTDALIRDMAGIIPYIDFGEKTV